MTTLVLPRPAWRLLALSGYFACLAALASTLVGMWTLYGRHAVLTHWTQVDARVEGCRVDRYEALLRGGPVSFAVACRLAYEMGQVRYRIPVRSHFTVRGADSLVAWVNAHPKGTTLAVRVDPRHPAAISLEGVDVLSSEASAMVGFRAALAFAGAGLLLVLAGVLLDRQSPTQGARTWKDRSTFRTPPMGLGVTG